VGSEEIRADLEYNKYKRRKKKKKKKTKRGR